MIFISPHPQRVQYLGVTKSASHHQGCIGMCWRGTTSSCCIFTASLRPWPNAAFQTTHQQLHTTSRKHRKTQFRFISILSHPLHHAKFLRHVFNNKTEVVARMKSMSCISPSGCKGRCLCSKKPRRFQTLGTPTYTRAIEDHLLLHYSTEYCKSSKPWKLELLKTILTNHVLAINCCPSKINMFVIVPAAPQETILDHSGLGPNKSTSRHHQ